MFILNRVLILFLFLNAGVAWSADETVSSQSAKEALKKELLMGVGRDQVVDINFEANEVSGKGVIEGDPTVVKATLIRQDGKATQLQFKPLKAGSTTVTVRDDKGDVKAIFDVTVTGTDLLKVKDEIAYLLRDIEGVELKIVGNKIVADGEVVVPSDYGRLLAVLSDETYGGNVLNLTTMSPLGLQVIARRIQQDVNAFAPQVKVRVVNGQIWLEGTVDSEGAATRALKVAELYVPSITPPGQLDRYEPNALRLDDRPIIQNFMVVNIPPQKKEEKLVRITVHFVELAKDYLNAFGFKWQPGFVSNGPQITFGTSADSGGLGGASLAATISNLLPKLASASNAGYARILESSTVVTRSGQPAKIRNVKNIPFAIGIQGANGNVSAAANTANVGTDVSVTPAILGKSDDIQMQINVKQTSLAGSNGSAPITDEHGIETRVYVKSAESAAVAGTESSNVTTNFNKDDPSPGTLSSSDSSGTSVEPLFSLIRSKSFQKSKRRFVVFVTPQIMESASEGTQDLKKNFRIKAE